MTTRPHGHEIADALHVPTNDTTSKTNAQYQPWQKVATGILGALKSTTAVSQLQAQLLQAGFYDAPETNDPTKIKEGNLDTYTIKALGQALQATSAANAQGQLVNWSQFLSKQAAGNPSYQPGQTLSDAENASGTAAAKQATQVIQDTQGQLAPDLRSAFEADLGFAPSAAQLADFTSQYQTLQQQHASSVNPNGVTFVDQNNIPEIQGIASPTAAAGNYAVNNDTNAYLAHQVSNAAALMMNAFSSNGTNARPLGSDPNVTSAARPF